MQIALRCSDWREDKAKMSLGAERRMENRLRQLEAMLKEPRSAINLESLLVSSPSFSHECLMPLKDPLPSDTEKKEIATA